MPHKLGALFRKIRRLEIETKHLATDVLAGLYRSTFKGRGMEFEEVREYQPGDDIRTIDWNVTARSGRPFVKNFREEREINVTLVVDISPSTLFGSVEPNKRDFMTEIVALFAFSALKAQDKIGLLLFSDGVDRYFPPKKGSSHVLRLLRELLSAQSNATKTDPKAALAFLLKIQRRRGIVIFLSDLLFADAPQELKIVAHHHDFISIAILDRFEKAFPDLGLVQLQDLESRQPLLFDSSAPENRQSLANAMSHRIEEHRKIIAGMGGTFLLLENGQPYLSLLRHFLAQRRVKRL